MVAHGTMDDETGIGPDGLVDVFRYRGEKTGLPEEAIIPFKFGHNFKPANEAAQAWPAKSRRGDPSPSFTS